MIDTVGNWIVGNIVPWILVAIIVVGACWVVIKQFCGDEIDTLMGRRRR